jgi:hypothetical protein
MAACARFIKLLGEPENGILKLHADIIAFSFYSKKVMPVAAPIKRQLTPD